MSNHPASAGKYERKKKKKDTQTATQWIQNEGMRKIENRMLDGLWDMYNKMYSVCMLYGPHDSYTYNGNIQW